MWNLKVSTLQLSSVLGRNRFRSGRFWGGGGGGAAGELVLDCQSCPVYHLDGLIVLQSQLSSLENCVDLHSKKPPMRLSTSGASGETKPDASHLMLCFPTFFTYCTREWHPTCTLPPPEGKRCCSPARTDPRRPNPFLLSAFKANLKASF